MKRVLFLDREDLVGGKKLTATADVEAVDFDNRIAKIEDYEMVIFRCKLTDTYKVVKNRYGGTTREMVLKGRENMEKFGCCVLEDRR